MGLTLTALPDPQSQLRSLQQALHEKSLRVEALTEELRQERLKSAKLEIGAGELQRQLGPLFRALQFIFGVVDDMEMSPAFAPGPASSAKKAVWESWKQKLGGKTAEAIDILMLHGPMSVSNLRIHLSCAGRTAQNVAQKLISTGIAKRENGRIALKEL
jgi:hypothetical protein